MSSDDCYDKAVDLLARRPHFQRELERKLSARGFGSDEIEAACERLTARGLLDDLEGARGLAAGAWRRRGYGPLKIRAELRRRGVADEVIDTIVREGADSEVERAEEVARRWQSRSDRGRDALARHLTGKGYSGETIYEVLSRLDS